jgi:hypothetical protein
MAGGRGLRRGLMVVAALVAMIAGATYVSGELGEIAVLQTFGDAGEVYSTKLWVVDLDGTVVRPAHPLPPDSRPARAGVRTRRESPGSLTVLQTDEPR